jgi:prepilin-type N-terminal cleavage/methylation domain-containing protein
MLRTRWEPAAFTLTELLVVVAVISILAAIALPNFLHAQVRARVAACHSDMRAIGMALEMYYTDHNTYPPWIQNRVTGVDDRHPNQIRYYRLTTPTAYLSEIPRDPFSTRANAVD